MCCVEQSARPSASVVDRRATASASVRRATQDQHAPVCPLPIRFVVSYSYVTSMDLIGNKWSKQFDIRPHRGRIRTVQSYSPDGANVSSCVGMLAPPGEYDRTGASFRSPESTTQSANRSVQPFLHSSRQRVVGTLAPSGEYD